MRTCATCYYWMGSESAYRAPCGLDATYGDPAFDEGCAQHRPRSMPRRSITMHPGTPRELMEQLKAAGVAELARRGLAE
jgi:hypothetical protein